MSDFLIRKATGNDLSAIETIYNKIHDAEAAGLQTTGWIRGVYPVRQTTEAALQRDDLYVLEENGQVLGAAIINQAQVDVYKQGRWMRSVPDCAVCVLHGQYRAAPRPAARRRARRHWPRKPDRTRVFARRWHGP